MLVSPNSYSVTLSLEECERRLSNIIQDEMIKIYKITTEFYDSPFENLFKLVRYY